MRPALAIAAGVVVAALGAAGCKGKSAPAASTGSAAAAAVVGTAATPGTTTPAFDACGLGTRLLAEVTPCASTANAKDWKMTQQGFTTVADTVRKTGNASSQIMCAQMLQAVEGDLGKIGCTMTVSSAERTQLADLMASWYAQRTPVVPTGDAASDEVITRIARARDRMCACTDLACLTEVDATLDLLGAFPKSAPAKAKELGGKLVDDMGRCETRVKQLGH